MIKCCMAENMWNNFCDIFTKNFSFTLATCVNIQHIILLRLVWTIDFFMFTIFKISWFLSARGSVLQVQAKIKNIFLNLSINSINLKMSIYLSISKICSSLFSRGNQACTCIANAKRTTQSRDAELSAIYIEGTRLTFDWRVDLGNQFASLKTTVKFMTVVEEWWTHFLILLILPSGFGWNWCQNWRFILSTMCANDRNFCVSTRPLRSFLVLFVTTFEQKHHFLRVHFEAVITIFWTIWTIYYTT